MITCGQCLHGKFLASDLGKRTCKGGPPQVVVIPMQGGIGTSLVYPQVGVNDEACGQFKLIPGAAVTIPPMDSLCEHGSYPGVCFHCGERMKHEIAVGNYSEVPDAFQGTREDDGGPVQP